jgi:hypothetical protein
VVLVVLLDLYPTEMFKEWSFITVDTQFSSPTEVKIHRKEFAVTITSLILSTKCESYLELQNILAVDAGNPQSSEICRPQAIGSTPETCSGRKECR